LFNAGFFSASVLPLSTAYVVCEGLGVESGVDKRFREAPFFYGLYTLLILGGGVAVMLIPNGRLMQWYVSSQALNGILLPVVIVLMLLLINRKDLMGTHTNSHWFNAIAWTTAIIVSILSVILMVQQWWPSHH
jgi:Mn2+/Fe2+ NRAMP family transporter